MLAVERLLVFAKYSAPLMLDINDSFKLTKSL
jgi:hypothetical protein